MRYYGHCGHLGLQDGEDLRVARDADGRWYLYDWSGADPDRTDDGPMALVEPVVLQVGVRSTRTSVEDRRGGEFYTAVLSKNLHRLLAMLDAAGTEYELEYDAEVEALRALP